MSPEAEALAPAAIEDPARLPSYLGTFGAPVLEVYEDFSITEAAVTRVLIFDFGAQRGRCRVDSYRTVADAQQLAPRNANEARDTRAPIQRDLLRGSAPRGRPNVGNNPTFLFGRHVALCSQTAVGREAFKALEAYSRDAQARASGPAG